MTIKERFEKALEEYRLAIREDVRRRHMNLPQTDREQIAKDEIMDIVRPLIQPELRLPMGNDIGDCGIEVGCTTCDRTKPECVDPI